MTADMHQQPGRVTARTAAQRECLFRGLYAGFHPDHVLNFIGQTLIQRDQEIRNRAFFTVNLADPASQFRARFWRFQIGRQLFFQLVPVVERELLGVFLDKKIKGIDHRHRCDQLHLNREAGHLFRKHKARHMVAERVLLPVDEVLTSANLEAVGINWRAAVRCGTQADEMGRNRNRLVELVVGFMPECNANSHVPLSHQCMRSIHPADQRSNGCANRRASYFVNTVG